MKSVQSNSTVKTRSPEQSIVGGGGCEGPATLLQSCIGYLKSVEILQSFSLEKVNFSVNYVILSVISFVKCFRKFTAYLIQKPQFCMILRHTIFHYNLTISENSSRLYNLVQDF